MSRQERELDAAEYVVGTLSGVERRAFEASIANDSDTRRDVRFWERAFGALNASVAPAAAPDNMFARIETELFSEPSAAGPAGITAMAAGVSKAALTLGDTSGGDTSGGDTSGGETADGAAADHSAPKAAANDNLLALLQRSRGRWRFGAVAATIAALGLGGFLANERYGFVDLPGAGVPTPVAENTAPAPGGLTGSQYVAVVNAAGDQPSLIVTVNPQTGDVSVRSLGVDRPDGKSLELWYVPEGQTAVSVGLVGEGQIDLKDITAKDGDLLAISLEPRGGSPTGTATGPVIYTGKLIKDPTPAN
ncbi:MAG: anti-sigma factor [Pseudomonadota bacterium]